MQYFLGVDAGGTKTEFVLGDATRELGRVRVGTIKRMKADAATTEANLEEALRQLEAATGKIVTAGGWGPALADQGSGHFLGLEGLRRGFLAIDQRRPTRLLDDAQGFWKLASRSDLIEFANANPAPDYSKLAPLVVSAAEGGDSVAQEVIHQGGCDLALLASLVIEHVRSLEGDPAPFHAPAIAIAGSILERVTPLREALVAALRQRYPVIAVLDVPADPPAGALWKARQTATSPSA
jgi:glucosamine kinase